MMKNVEKLVYDLKERKPIGLIYDGSDYGIYKFNQEKNWYQGVIGHIDLENLYRAIKDESYFIQAYEVKEN